MVPSSHRPIDNCRDGGAGGENGEGGVAVIWCLHEVAEEVHLLSSKSLTHAMVEFGPHPIRAETEVWAGTGVLRERKRKEEG